MEPIELFMRMAGQTLEGEIDAKIVTTPRSKGGEFHGYRKLKRLPIFRSTPVIHITLENEGQMRTPMD